MEVTRVSNKDFDLTHTFECGQCFRWNRADDGSYSGVAGSKAVRLRQDGDSILIENCSAEDFDSFWRGYLDLDRDYGEIKQAVSINELMRNAVSFGGGIRILRQEFFETLISYIISQNNSIPNIKRVVERLCSAYGEPVMLGDEVRYAFPSAQRLASLNESDFRSLGAGFRDRYLAGVSRLAAEGALDPDRLSALPTAEARAELMKIKGVGNKVCDCVLLFALGKFDLFPTDTWIKKVMSESFSTDSVSAAKNEGERIFGQYSGFAQQYLFYWRRETDKTERSKPLKSL